MKALLILIVAIFVSGLLPVDAAEYGVAQISTPVLNTPGFQAVFGGGTGRDLKTDRCGQVRELEYIALPGTVFTVLKKQQSGSATIYQVTTDEYTAPPNVRLYVDSRFIRLEQASVPRRQPSLRSRGDIVAALKATAGSHYVWGGNVPGGVPELLAWFYTVKREDDGGRLALAGLDCSGLLYHATGGYTPRNTAQLLLYGTDVAIAGKTSAEIAAMLQPLDLIVWNGHVIIVLDPLAAIESRLECGKSGNGGVVMTSLPKRITEIMRTRSPANAVTHDKKPRDIFVVRRWYDRQQALFGDK